VLAPHAKQRSVVVLKATGKRCPRVPATHRTDARHGRDHG
jgi:hypothetical protein